MAIKVPIDDPDSLAAFNDPLAGISQKQLIVQIEILKQLKQLVKQGQAVQLAGEFGKPQPK